MKRRAAGRRQGLVEHGRRTTIDYGSETVKRILAAAEKLFAEDCFAGTRIDDIATLAGVNKATIYYHIGGKEKIYEVVLHRHFKRIADRLESELASCVDPVAGLLGVIRIHQEYFKADSRAPRTVAHELAGGSKHMTAEIIAEYGRIHAISARFLQAGVETGCLREVNPALLHVVFAGSLLINTINEPFRDRLSELLALPSETMPSIDDVASFLEKILLEFLTNS
jgi:TetR/AcrR family transcriptional regulator